MLKQTTLFVVAVVITAATFFAAAPTAHADPFGTDYGLELTLFRPIPQSLPLALEVHRNAQIPFDGTNKIGVLTHIAPNPDVDNDLNVMEMVTPGTDSEHIAIWIEGQELFGPNEHVPMFTETVPVDGDMVRLNLDNLYWKDFNGTSIIENLRFLVTFPGTLSQVPQTTDLQLSGDGTQASPFSLRADFDAAFFDLDGQGILDATDFHIEFDVRHVPEPGTATLFLLGAAACLGFTTRRRR